MGLQSKKKTVGRFEQAYFTSTYVHVNLIWRWIDVKVYGKNKVEMLS